MSGKDVNPPVVKHAIGFVGPQATQLLGVGHPLGWDHHDALEDSGYVPQGEGVV